MNQINIFYPNIISRHFFFTSTLRKAKPFRATGANIHTDALFELGAVEQPVLGELVEPPLVGRSPAAAVGAADELEPLEHVRDRELVLIDGPGPSAPRVTDDTGRSSCDTCFLILDSSAGSGTRGRSVGGGGLEEVEAVPSSLDREVRY